MAEPAEFSIQTVAVLATLASTSSDWRHGYDLAKVTGLKSGTLYPILIRLADRGLVEAKWEDEQPAGRPRRHLYRLTPAGGEAARAATTTRAAATGRATTPKPATARGSGRRRVAIEGAS